jgi:uncharacterized protein YegL
MKDHTFIAIILDKSGSMQNEVTATKNCFKEFIQEQQQYGNNADIQVSYFDRSCYTKPVQPISEDININDYVASGMTALYNTLGQRIVEIGNYLSSLHEENRPNKVVVCIITDGENTISGGYAQETVTEMIRHQETKYNWKFLFLGADPRIANQGVDLGIKNVAAYVTTNDAYRTMSNFTKSVRSAN